MALIRKKKSRKDQVVDRLGHYVEVAKRTPPRVRAIPLVVVGAGVATVVAIKKLRGGDEASPATA
jgi:hypothetical protein